MVLNVVIKKMKNRIYSGLAVKGLTPRVLFTTNIAVLPGSRCLSRAVYYVWCTSTRPGYIDTTATNFIMTPLSCDKL